jgi:cyclic pyranopterin phosphate synthase
MSENLRDQFRRPLHDLRISLIDQCNFRCPYCMPKEIFGPDYAFLPRREMLSNEELIPLVRLFVRGGVRKIRLTGGEPLLRPGLADLIAALHALPGADDLALTTNGWLLERMSGDLAAAGLHRINVSLDSLDPEVFGRMNGRGLGPDAVLAGIDSAVAAGLEVKVNMVVQKGVNDGEILPMARHFRRRGLTLRFIEFMDVGNCNHWSLDQVVPALQIVEQLSADHPLEPLDPGYRGEVASRYRYQGTDTEIGLIASVTEPFCRDCHRARLSADGKLFTCLFATQGTDFKALLRSGASDEDLWRILQTTWEGRHDRYSEERFEAGAKLRRKVEMSYIGG